MIRTLFLVVSILAVAVMPNPAHGGSGGHGHHRFHHFGGFFVVPYFYDPYLDYPYPYYYPYPVSSSRSLWSSHRWSISRRRSSVKWSIRTGSMCSLATA